MSHRKRGAGTAFAASLMETGRLGTPSIGYSPRGLATVLKAHRQVVEKAINEGRRVPRAVLVDYIGEQTCAVSR